MQRMHTLSGLTFCLQLFKLLTRTEKVLPQHNENNGQGSSRKEYVWPHDGHHKNTSDHHESQLLEEKQKSKDSMICIYLFF